MKLACEKRQWNEIVHKKKTPFFGEKMNWSDNINFFWKSFLSQIVYLNKTKLSFHFEYFFPTSRLQAKFLWKLSLQTKGKKVFCEKIERKKKKLFYSRLNGVSSIHFVCWGDLFFFLPQELKFRRKRKHINDAFWLKITVAI